MTTDLTIVVPAKDTAQAKSRLASLLSPEARRTLADLLFQHTLSVLRTLRTPATILVVTDSPRLAEGAGEAGAEVVRDDGASLTAAVELATRYSVRRGFGSQLVIPSDIALLDAEEIEELLATPRATRSVVLCPSSDEGGTNALLTSPPDVIPIWYGPGSFARYRAAAEGAEIPVTVRKMPSLALDLDTPEDVRRFIARAPGGPILDLLRQCHAIAS